MSSVFHSEGEKSHFKATLSNIYLTLAPVLTINSKKSLLANFKNA